MALSKFPVGGPVHQLLTRLITKKNIEALGFLDWPKVHEILQKGFEKQDPNVMRKSFITASYVVLGQRFNMRPATGL